MGHASILRKKKKKSPKTTQLWKTNAVIEIFISVEHDYVSVYIHKWKLKVCIIYENYATEKLFFFKKSYIFEVRVSNFEYMTQYDIKIQ